MVSETAVPFQGGEIFNPADWVRVTNNDPDSIIGRGKTARKALVARYNGKDYVFPYREPVNIPIAAAQHIFDLGKDDKSAALARLGWVRTGDDIPEAMDRLCNYIRFEDIPELMEAQRFSRAVTRATDLAESGGEEGEASASPEPDADEA